MSPGPTFGPYPTSGVLGSGGMGVVYLARDPKLGRDLAIKTLTAGRNAGETQRRRFQREARALAELSHPGLVSIVDAGVQDGVPWLAMLRVEGQTLEERIRSEGPLAPEGVCDLGVQLCAALAVAHGRGILHRDLKPENVLVTNDGRYVITDFGLTKDLAGEVSGDLSKTGALIGTPGYWAPEQAMGRSSQATPATDVYGLGAVLYAALTGVPPISAPSLLEAVVATKERPPEPPSTRVDVPIGLEKVVLKCLEKSADDRYDSVDMLEEALRELGREQAQGRRGALLVAGAVLAFLSGVAGVWLLGEGGDPPGPSPTEVAESSSAPSPTSAAGPEPTRQSPPTSPASSAEDAALRARRAIESRAWDEGHAALGESSSLPAVWSRYLLLREEVEHLGGAEARWHERRDQALELASRARRSAAGSNEVWAKGLVALTGALKDPFLDPSASLAVNREEWELDLQGALAQTTNPERSLALHQALAELALHDVFSGPGETVAAGKARGRLSAWEAAGGARWKLLLLRARLELFVGLHLENVVADLWDLELESLRAGRPWLRSAVNYLRGEFVQGFARTDQLHVWRSLVGDLHCPLVLRGHATNRLGATLLELDSPKEAIEVLRQAPAPPSPRVASIVMFDRVCLEAWARTRCGQSARALEALAKLPEHLQKGFRVQLLRGVALGRLGRRQEARAAVEAIALKRLGRHRELILEFAALTAKPGETYRALKDVLRGAKSLEVLVCVDRLEALLASPGPTEGEGLPNPAALRRLVKEIRSAYSRTIEDLVEDHLHAGLWAFAARRVDQILGRSAEGAELRARLDFRILVRALEEVRPDDELFQALHKRALHVAVSTLDRALPHHVALINALLVLGATPEGGNVIELQAGIQVRPKWWELYEATDRVLRARARSPKSSPNVIFRAHLNVCQWLTRAPQDSRGALARAGWLPPELAVKVLAGNQVSVRRLKGVFLARIQRARAVAGLVSPRQAAKALGLAGHSRLLLTRTRAEVLLDQAETHLQALGSEQEALLALDLLRSWCGEELGDPARYYLLRARALSTLGRGPEALIAARRAAARSEGREPELRARALAALGRAEVAAKREGGLARLRQAQELAPCFEVWLATARVSAGRNAEAAYAEALSYAQDSAQLRPLWREVSGRGLDSIRVGRQALSHLEGRGISTLRVLVALGLFSEQRDPRVAALFSQAVVQTWLSVGKAALKQEEIRVAFQQARALLPGHLRELVEAVGETMGALTEIYEGQLKELSPRLSAALARVEEASAALSPQERSDYWLPSLRLDVLESLRALQYPGLAELQGKILASTRALRTLERPSLRLEFWIARLEGVARDPSGLESLDRALAQSRGYPFLRQRILLERGLVLRREGRSDEALQCFSDLIRETDDPQWISLGLTLSAQIHRTRGPAGRVQQRLALSRADSLGRLGVSRFARVLQLLALCQFHLDEGDPSMARKALEASQELLGGSRSEGVRSEWTLLSATLARQEGDPAQGLRLLDGSEISTDSRATGTILERARILVALERRSEALKFLRESLAKDPHLWPVEREPLQAFATELAKELGEEPAQDR
jgi:serine/threonine protein kinase/tetratricopeptide (TPR) repeat protein